MRSAALLRVEQPPSQPGPPELPRYAQPAYVGGSDNVGLVIADLAYDEAGTGRPLVLLHAFPLSAAMFAPLRVALADSCRVVTPQLRGFGGSPLPDDEPSLDRMADDVAALLDRLGLDQVVLGGVSMGGYVTMALLRRHADRLDGIVLADTKAGADADAARANRERMARTVLESGDVQILLDELVPQLLADTTRSRRPEVVRQVEADVRTVPPAAAAWAQRAMAGRPDSVATLRSAAVPALVLVGAEDTVSPVAEAAAMADALPDSRLVRISAAGHLAALENPTEFAAAVWDFVRQL